MEYSISKEKDTSTARTGRNSDQSPHLPRLHHRESSYYGGTHPLHCSGRGSQPEPSLGSLESHCSSQIVSHPPHFLPLFPDHLQLTASWPRVSRRVWRDEWARSTGRCRDRCHSDWALKNSHFAETDSDFDSYIPPTLFKPSIAPSKQSSVRLWAQLNFRRAVRYSRQLFLFFFNALQTFNYQFVDSNTSGRVTYLQNCCYVHIYTTDLNHRSGFKEISSVDQAAIPRGNMWIIALHPLHDDLGAPEPSIANALIQMLRQIGFGKACEERKASSLRCLRNALLGHRKEKPNKVTFAVAPNKRLSHRGLDGYPHHILAV